MQDEEGYVGSESESDGPPQDVIIRKVNICISSLTIMTKILASNCAAF